MAEVTAFRNNALPYPVYGVPWTLVLPILDADGDPVTNGTIDSLVSLNGDTAAAGATPVQIATTTGLFYLILTAAQMTADIVSGSIGSTTAGAKRTLFTLYPRKLVQLATGTSQGGAAGYITLAAGAVLFDGQFNGCLCVATIDTLIEARVLQVCTQSNQQCTVTPGWNVTPDADDTYIIYNPEGRMIAQANVKAVSDDPTAADNLESACDNYSATRGLAGTDMDAILADTAELQTNQGAWATATGFSTHSPGDVKTAIEAAGSHLTLIKAVTDVLPDGGALTELLADAEDARAAAVAAEAAIAVVDGIVDTLLGRVVGTLATGTHQPQSADSNVLLAHATHGLAALKAIFDAIKGADWASTDNLKLIKAAIPAAAPTAQQVRDAMKLAPTAGAPVAGSIDAHLDTIELAGGAAGAGATACTLVQQTTLSVGIADVDLWVTSDADGLVIVAGTLQTNSQGKATFYLDNGLTYYRWAQKDGYNFANPKSFVAAAGERPPFTDGEVAAGPASGNRPRDAMVTNVRRLLREADPKEHTDDAVIYALDNALAEAWETLARIPNAGYCTVLSTPVALTKDKDEYGIPTNMVHIHTIQVRENAQATQWVDMESAGPGQWRNPRLDWTFTLLKSSVVLRPIPRTTIAGALRFVGTENPPTFAADGTTSGLPAVLDQVLEHLAAALLLFTEGSSLAAAFDGRGRGMLDRLLTLLARRHEGARNMNWREE